MDYRRAGSFRQRARNAERTTRQLQEHRRQRVAVRTHEAISEFEEHLRTVQESLNGAIDDLPMDAEAGHLRDHARRSINDKANQLARDGGSDSSSAEGRKTTWMRGSHSHLDLTGKTVTMGSTGGLDVDVRYDMRPPSPCGIYDYGCISQRPRSLLAQRNKEAGVSARPLYRQSSVGFYFPGAEFRSTSSYGFSMLDPIHMPQRVWEPCKHTPTRWPKDPADIRPATTEGREHRHRRSRTAGPTTSDIVRSTAGHDKRAALAFQSADKRQEESQLERVRHEQGVFEGRWRDPLLESQVCVPALAPVSPARCTFSDKEALWDSLQGQAYYEEVGSLILLGIEMTMHKQRSNLMKLFKAQNRGTVGALEPEEFLEALIKLDIVSESSTSAQDIVLAMHLIDPDFDGRINFTVLEGALLNARAARRLRVEKAERIVANRVKNLAARYGEKLPIDVVKVEREAKSIFDHERAFEKFKKQQKDLLKHHGEYVQSS